MLPAFCFAVSEFAFLIEIRLRNRQGFIHSNTDFHIASRVHSPVSGSLSFTFHNSLSQVAHYNYLP